MISWLIKKDALLMHVILLITLVIQMIRIFCGIDFNDEMQYYGELTVLLSSGKLFSADLFLQQNVYLLLVPIFKPFFLLWGTESLFLVGRIVFAIFVMWIFGWVRRTLVTTGVEPFAASVSALALTFAIPVGNIYAFSYNTVALGIVALCFAEFLVWGNNDKKQSLLFWGIAITILLLVYPPLALVVCIVLITRLIVERNYKFIAKLFTLGILLVLLGAFIFFQFTNLSNFLDSVSFSRSFGVGQVILSNKYHLIVFAMFISAVIIGIVLNQKVLHGSTIRLDMLKEVLINSYVVVFTVVAIFFAFRKFPNLYPISALSMVMLAYLLALRNVKDNLRHTLTWVSVLFLCISSIMPITSGNGFGQIIWPAMVATPFFFALAITKKKYAMPTMPDGRWGGWIFGAGLIIVFLIVYLANPYRDEKIWRLSASVEDAQAFRHIRLSDNKATAIKLIRATLSDIPPESRVMVVGAHPWIYFAIDAQFDTDMIFMHPQGGLTAMKILAGRLEKRRPQYLVISGIVTEVINESVNNLIRDGGYICDTRPVEPMLHNSKKNVQTFYDMFEFVTVCRLPGKNVLKNNSNDL